MSNFFFGQNVYKFASSTSYNITLTVNYPWTLSGETVAFKLMQGTTQVGSTVNVDLEVGIETETQLFTGVALSAGTYRIQLSTTTINGITYTAPAQTFTISDTSSNNINLEFNITAATYTNTMFNLVMASAADAQTTSVYLSSADGKDEVNETIQWNNPDSLPNKMWLPNYAASLIKNNATGKLDFNVNVTLDAISNNHIASVYLSNNRGETAGFNGSGTEFTFETNNFDGSVSFNRFFSDITKLTLNIELHEYYNV